MTEVARDVAQPASGGPVPSPTGLTLVGGQGVVCEGDFCYLPSQDAEHAEHDVPIQLLPTPIQP